MKTKMTTTKRIIMTSTIQLTFVILFLHTQGIASKTTTKTLTTTTPATTTTTTNNDDDAIPPPSFTIDIYPVTAYVTKNEPMTLYCDVIVSSNGRHDSTGRGVRGDKNSEFQDNKDNKNDSKSNNNNNNVNIWYDNNNKNKYKIDDYSAVNSSRYVVTWYKDGMKLFQQPQQPQQQQLLRPKNPQQFHGNESFKSLLASYETMSSLGTTTPATTSTAAEAAAAAAATTTTTTTTEGRRVQLSDGSLFFLNVNIGSNVRNNITIGGNNIINNYNNNNINNDDNNNNDDDNSNSNNVYEDSDLGYYHCTVTDTTTNVTVVSSPASIKLATISDPFQPQTATDHYQQQPQLLQLEAGEDAFIACRAPEGTPTPKIKWLKNDRPLLTDNDNYYNNINNDDYNNINNDYNNINNDYNNINNYYNNINHDYNNNGINNNDINNYSNNKNRFLITESGLTILSVTNDDVGAYRCVAYNEAGELKSVVVHLDVNYALTAATMTTTTRLPRRVARDTVMQGKDVIFHCQVTNESAPSWKKLDGEIPMERSQLTSDHSLKLLNVQPGDEGTYICTVHTPSGLRKETRAVLVVNTPPSVQVPHRDFVVNPGKRVVIDCMVAGSPTPEVTWFRSSNNQPIISSTMTSTAPDNNNNNNIKNINNKIRINNGNANNNNGKYRLLDTGSLIIDSVSVEDADEYVCRASSKVGRAEARVTLQVKDMDNLLPPIIIYGPQNQTLPQGETVTLTCTINHQSPSDDVTNFDDEKDAGYDNDEGGDENDDDDDEAKIRWLKNNALMKIDGVRVLKRSNGELVINDLRQSDTGTYTCSVISVSGETSWSAHLSVQSSSDPNVLFRRSPTISTFPGAPTTPLVNEVRQTSVRLSWKLNARRGSSEVEGSIVEVHCVECSTKTWTQRIYPGKSLMATINNLSPDTTYYFIVRSWNSHGIGAPSAVSSSVRTKGSKIPPSISLADIKMILASQQLVRPMSAQSLSSTSIQVEWGSFDEYKDIIDEFVVRYQDIDRNSAIQSRRAFHHVNQMTLNGLEKFTLYEVNVLPVYMGHEGIPTTARVKTSEDAPSVAPSNVQVTWHNNDSLLITWDPPPTLTHNGPLRGYKVYVTNNNTRLVRATQVDENVESFMIGNVIRDHYYTVRVTCFNRVGESPSSLDAVVAGHLQPLPFPPTNSNNVVNESWFVVVVIVVMGTLLWGVLCLLSVCMFRRHKKNKKKKVLQEDAETALRGGTLPNMTSGNSQRVPAKSSSTTTASGSQFPLLNNNQLMMDCQTRLNRCCYDNSHSPTDSKDDCHVINENQGHTYQTLDAHQSGYPHTWNAFGSVIVPMPTTNTTPHLDHQQQQSINQIGYFPSGEIPNPAAYMIRCPPANSSGGSSVVNQSETIIEANEDDHDLGYNVAGRCGAGSHCGSNSSYGGHNESGSAGKYYAREEAGKKFHFHNNKNNNNNYGNNNNFDNCNKYSSPHHSSAGSSLASANHESNQPLLYCYNGELDNIGPTMASSRYIVNGEPNHNNNNNICNNHNNNICNNINNSNYYDQVPNDNVINNPYNNNNKKLHLIQQHCNTPESFISDTDCDGEDAPRIISMDDASTTSSTSTKSDNDVVVVGVADQNVAKQLQQQQQQQQQLKYQKPQIGFMTALNYNSKQQIASNNSSSINNNNGFCPTVKNTSI